MVKGDHDSRQPLRQDKLSSPRNPKEESATNSFLNLPAIQKQKIQGWKIK